MRERGWKGRGWRERDKLLQVSQSLARLAPSESLDAFFPCPCLATEDVNVQSSNLFIFKLNCLI